MLIQKVTIYNLFSQAEINVNKIMFDNSVQVKMIENNIQIIFLSMLLLKVK